MHHLPHKYISSKNSQEICRNFAWTTTVILGSSSVDQISYPAKPYQLFSSSGSRPNAHSLVHLIRSCTHSGTLSQGQKFHGYILKRGFNLNAFVSTALINFYVKFDLLREAHLLFDEIPEPTVVSWNSLISGYVHSGQLRKALKLFVRLERSNLRADSFSFTTALSACGQLSLVEVGRSLHSKIVKFGVDCSVFVANCLIDMYGKCGYVYEATQIFENQIERDNITWNSAISASARNGKLEEASAIFSQMPYPDTISYNELIDGIARFGNMEDAVDLLLNMPHADSSSWNSIVTGYINRGKNVEALNFLCNMHSRGVHKDEYTFSIVLSGIASLSANIWGKLIHSCVLKYGLDRCVVVGTALIGMYFKCGLIKEAEIIFRSMPQINLVTWNTVISGYAHNCQYNKVIELFEELKATKNTRPDEITFLNLLSACCHNKIPLKIACRYLETMILDYSISPMPEHCSFMIRLMGQEGDVSKACKMIHDLELDSCWMVWKTLLGACVTCGNIEVAAIAANKLIELEGDDDHYVYVMMSNIYANDGKWEDAGRIRRLMREKNVIKEVGYSRIESDSLIASWS